MNNSLKNKTYCSFFYHFFLYIWNVWRSKFNNFSNKKKLSHIHFQFVTTKYMCDFYTETERERGSDVCEKTQLRWCFVICFDSKIIINTNNPKYSKKNIFDFSLFSKRKQIFFSFFFSTLDWILFIRFFFLSLFC